MGYRVEQIFGAVTHLDEALCADLSMQHRFKRIRECVRMQNDALKHYIGQGRKKRTRRDYFYMLPVLSYSTLPASSELRGQCSSTGPLSATRDQRQPYLPFHTTIKIPHNRTISRPLFGYSHPDSC